MTDVYSEIISFRSDELTLVFKTIPFFASDSFYILFIAFGFWRQPRNRLFWDLGFLVPLSTLLNCTLKNLFSIARPDQSAYLLPVQDPFGFPSGDVQVAVVFWGMLCLASRSLWLSILAICLILLMMFSRIYLGVHSPYDVMAGIIFGVLTLWIYQAHISQFFVYQWFLGKTRSYWGFVMISILVYALLSLQTPTSPMVIMALGALIGYGLSLEWIFPQLHSVRNEQANLLLICLSLGLLSGVAFIFPVIKDGPRLLFWGTGLLKYAFLVILIYVLIPHLRQWMSSQFVRKK